MSTTTRRVGIVLAAIAAAAFYVCAFVVFAIGRVGCEDAEEPDWHTVRCDSERGANWTTFEWVLWGLALVVLIAGLVWSLKRARFAGVLLSAAVVVAAVVAIFAIEDKELGDQQVPEVTGVEVLNTECEVPCSEGFKVRVTTDIDAQLQLGIEPANFDDIGGRQYNDLVDGEDAGEGADVDAGTHEFAIGGEIINPPAERGPLPAGEYELVIYARPQNAGNQEEASSDEIKRPVTIKP